MALSWRGAESVEVHVEQPAESAQFVYVVAGYSMDVVGAEASQDLIRRGVEPGEGVRPFKCGGPA